MNDIRGPPTLPPRNLPNGPSMPNVGAVPNNNNMRRSVRMAKCAGETSFGMTLDQHVDARPEDYPRVSYVFPNSAANRAGVCSGWTIESINDISCRGHSVRDVAAMFRNLQEVLLVVDVRTEVAPVTTLPPLAGTTNMTASSAFPTRTAPAFVPVPASMVRATAPAVPNPTMSANANGATSSALQHVSAPIYDYQQGPVPTWSALPVSAATAQARTAPSSTTPPQPTPVSSHGVSPLQSAPRSTPPATANTTTTSTVPPVAKASVPQAIPPTAPTLVIAKRPPTAPSPSILAATAPTSRAVPPPAPMTSNAPVSMSVMATIATQRNAPAALTPPRALASSASASTASTAVAAVVSPTQSAMAPLTTAPSRSTNGSNRASGKKRGRSQSDQHVAAVATAQAATPPAPEKKRGRPAKRRQSAPPPVSEIWDDEDAAFFYASDSDVEEVSPPPSTGRRTSSRQAESGGRARRSLTVTRLMTMGFEQEDAELSVQACGHDPDKCMLWIVSHLEEKQFTNDLNKASIESENQRRLEEQKQKKQETETIRQATAFTSLFGSSYILSDHAEAPRLKEMLSSTIGEIAADTLMRTLMTKLLTVESKAIRWYKEASKCYMLQLAARLEIAFGSHDAVACCAKLMATHPASEACSFVQALHEEEQALTKALFFMPENHGGVPLEFLRADESMQFSLDDDGFEVVDQPPKPASPGHD